LSLIFLDIDHFKKFNDNNGHAAGDEVLRELGEILARHSSRSVHPCRIGGEEFAILCPGHAQGQAGALADEIRAEISEITVISGGVSLPSITASAGIAELCKADNAADIMARADDALYSAKTTGRNRTELWAGDISQD
jgi:diguanylate cyclase (GGDEF)-like protein